MLREIDVTDQVTIVFSYDEPGYSAVLKTLGKAKFVDVATYSLSTVDTNLIERLRNLGPEVEVRIITNLPKRFES